jgi:hypothetical protein
MQMNVITGFAHCLPGITEPYKASYKTKEQVDFFNEVIAAQKKANN